MTTIHPRFFYFCYRHNLPRGGQKHTYRHVDILNRNGFDAAIFHPGDDGFRLTWFENQTCVISEAEFFRRVRPDQDFVVLPEDMGIHIHEFPGRKVVFNKNVFTGFQSFGLSDVSLYPYHSPEVVAAFTVSDHNREVLQFSYPNLMVEKVDVEIDETIFQYRNLTAKQPQIVCALKNQEMLLPIYHMVQSRTATGMNNGQKFEWVFLEHCTEEQTAELLGNALLFLFFNVSEGLGRMPLEAMASGCITIAYSYGPLKATIPYSELEYGDLVGVVRFIESVLASYPSELDQWREGIESGRKIAKQYSLKNQEHSVLAAWRNVFERSQTIIGAEQNERTESP